MGWLLTDTAVVLMLTAGACLLPSRRVRGLVLRLGLRMVSRARRTPLWPPARPEPLRPLGRPIELIAADARRLRPRFRATRSGVSFAKSEAVRSAYDRVLGEGCDALDEPHLLDVLPIGDDLDAERLRVERLLHIWGLSFDDAA